MILIVAAIQGCSVGGTPSPPDAPTLESLFGPMPTGHEADRLAMAAEDRIVECLEANGFPIDRPVAQPTPPYLLDISEFHTRYGYGIAASRSWSNVIDTLIATSGPMDTSALETIDSCADTSMREVYGGRFAVIKMFDDQLAAAEAAAIEGLAQSSLDNWIDCMNQGGVTVNDFDDPVRLVAERATTADSDAEWKALATYEMTLADLDAMCREHWVADDLGRALDEAESALIIRNWEDVLPLLGQKSVTE